MVMTPYPFESKHAACIRFRVNRREEQLRKNLMKKKRVKGEMEAMKLEYQPKLEAMEPQKRQALEKEYQQVMDDLDQQLKQIASELTTKPKGAVCKMGCKGSASGRCDDSPAHGSTTIWLKGWCSDPNARNGIRRDKKEFYFTDEDGVNCKGGDGGPLELLFVGCLHTCTNPTDSLTLRLQTAVPEMSKLVYDFNLDRINLDRTKKTAIMRVLSDSYANEFKKVKRRKEEFDAAQDAAQKAAQKDLEDGSTSTAALEGKVSQLVDLAKINGELQKNTDETVAKLADQQQETNRELAVIKKDAAERQQQTDKEIADTKKAAVEQELKTQETFAKLAEQQIQTQQDVSKLAQQERHTKKRVSKLEKDHEELEEGLDQRIAKIVDKRLKERATKKNAIPDPTMPLEDTASVPSE
ncbi:MAG: hypothetical protein SGARI_002707, partial [Bacillariaceae sp.]